MERRISRQTGRPATKMGFTAFHPLPLRGMAAYAYHAFVPAGRMGVTASPAHRAIGRHLRRMAGPRGIRACQPQVRPCRRREHRRIGHPSDEGFRLQRPFIVVSDLHDLKQPSSTEGDQHLTHEKCCCAHGYSELKNTPPEGQLTAAEPVRVLQMCRSIPVHHQLPHASEASYADRVFTTAVVAYPACPYP